MSKKQFANGNQVGRLAALCDNAIELVKSGKRDPESLLKELQDFKEAVGPHRTCVVGYATGLRAGYIHGYRFERMERCCDAFWSIFSGTGNRKIPDFNTEDAAPHGEKPGINLVTRGADEMTIELHVLGLSTMTNIFRIKHCPFCGAKIEVREVKRVTLKDRFVQVRDGFEEVESQDV